MSQHLWHFAVTALTVEHGVEIGRDGGQHHAVCIDGVAAHFQAHVAELWQETNGSRNLIEGRAAEQEADETGKVSVYTNPINDGLCLVASCRRDLLDATVVQKDKASSECHREGKENVPAAGCIELPRQ